MYIEIMGKNWLSLIIAFKHIGFSLYFCNGFSNRTLYFCNGFSNRKNRYKIYHRGLTFPVNDLGKTNIMKTY